MPEPNVHEMILSAWAKVLRAIEEKRLSPLLLVSCLETLVSDEQPKVATLIDGMVTSTESFLNQLKAVQVGLSTGIPVSSVEELLQQSVSELNLPPRARKGLNRLGISTLGELVERTTHELLGLKNFGKTSLMEIRVKLRERGLKLKND